MVARAKADGSAVVLGTVVKDASWWKPVRLAGRLAPGDVPAQSLTVPVDAAQRLLRDIIRFVVDIPAGTSTVVVWQRQGSELWIDVGTVSIACDQGLVRIGASAGCDQLPKPVVLTVPIGVGTPDRPSGLVMATIDRIEGPDDLVALWSEAMTAFAWEALVELARHLCAGAGKDKAGLALIPGAIAATKGALLIQPMARNDLAVLER